MPHSNTTCPSRLLFLATSLLATGLAAETDPAYQQAIEDAVLVRQDEISDQLLPIRPDNAELIWNDDKSKVLVSTWKAQGAYERFLKDYSQTSDNPEYAVWVTAVPQVRNLCAAVLADQPENPQQAVDLRLKQYLGLAPDWQYDVFVEMWVSPDDLFRPCVDPEIGDTACELHFGEESPKVRNISNYREFYENTYYKSFRGSAGVPWTGLGYTYDWGNPETEVGASEYILVPGAQYEIKQVVPTLQYCAGE